MIGGWYDSKVSSGEIHHRRRRARDSLDGLSVGDAFGERMFGPPEQVVPRIEARKTAAGPWRYTDDTEMALSVVEQLEVHGGIDQDDLAKRFALRMDPTRGYGLGAFEVLAGIRDGRPWRACSRGAFRGRGSFGNGAAMRVAPIGAYFADDLDRVARESAASAEVTHAHPEGVAGAVAVGIAAALCAGVGDLSARAFLDAVIARTPAGYTRDGVAEAAGLLDRVGTLEAAKVLGNGAGVTAPDTVPFCLWIVAGHLRASYADALWETVRALGDRDTTCAIVGGVLVLRTGVDGIPAHWRTSREPLPLEPMWPER